ncbi:hypothetical protein L1987_46392 [Smallanthus sonchifolius]|uniref:Uncharacterized protein n=1 Tax=Smallanthus sonchifolius TaxID=185202 RepID=A0ACB9G0N3_9ASTR|nr:hypothetical protein L1987_46392 [Smallanthus sonchifolius]
MILRLDGQKKGYPLLVGSLCMAKQRFSHRIVYNKKGGDKFSYVISPQKGEIWALFKDWDINWSSDPESHKKFKFDIVEILSVHDDCVSVAFLMKVKGFSHHIPSAKLTGNEKAGVPTGSFELDMASLPGDLEDYCHYYSNNVHMASQSHEEKVKPTINFANTPKKDMNGLDKDLLKLRRSPRGVKSPKQEYSSPCPMPDVGSDKVNDGQNSFSACGMPVSHDFKSNKQIWKFQAGQIWAFWKRIIKFVNVMHKLNRLNVNRLDCMYPCLNYATRHAVDIMRVVYLKCVLQIWALCKKQEAGGFEIIEVVETNESSTEKIVVIPRIELHRFSHQISAFLYTDGCFKAAGSLIMQHLPDCTCLNLTKVSQSSSDSKLVHLSRLCINNPSGRLRVARTKAVLQQVKQIRGTLSICAPF